MKQSLAFTIAAREGRLREIVCEIEIRQSEDLCKIFGLRVSPVKCIALWDTGCTYTVINKRIAENLRLEPVGVTECAGVNKTVESSVYEVDLLLPNKLIVSNVRVCEVKNVHGADILIGMDIIMIGDFVITNAGNKTVVSFRYPPGDDHIDFVKQIREKAMN